MHARTPLTIIDQISRGDLILSFVSVLVEVSRIEGSTTSYSTCKLSDREQQREPISKRQVMASSLISSHRKHPSLVGLIFKA